MKRAIAMRCNEQQFNEILSKLKIGAHYINLKGAFDEYPYLTNYYNSVDGNIGFTNKMLKNEKSKIFEEWNQKTFLEACGIQKPIRTNKLTELEKRVKVLEGKVDVMKINNMPKNHSLSLETERKFAITERQIKELYELTGFESNVNNKLRQFFPEVVKDNKVELEVGKWYKSESCGGSLFFATEFSPDKKNAKGYGFEKCEWYNNFSKDAFYWSCQKNIVLATPEEVTEALTKEAVKRGFVSGCYWIEPSNVFMASDKKRLAEGKIKLYTHDCNGLCFSESHSLIFKDGVWGTVIETITKEDAEKELGKKILN